ISVQTDRPGAALGRMRLWDYSCPDELIGDRVDPCESRREVVAESVAIGKLAGWRIGHLRPVTIRPYEHLERQVERHERGGGHDRRTSCGAAEQDDLCLAQIEPDRSRLATVIDHHEHFQ